jgi:hypothetical protein
MPNSSSSKYVKMRRHRHRHRHTKSRRHAKKYTIKKVMHGCSSKQIGGATASLGSSNVSGGTIEVNMPHNAVRMGGADNILAATANVANANATKLAMDGKPESYTSTNQLAYTSTQTGGYKSKHRRRRYKKSIGRKCRSRRFRWSCN